MLSLKPTCSLCCLAEHLGHVPAWLEKQLMRTFWPKAHLFWPVLFKGSGGGEGVIAQPPWSEHEMQSPGCKALNTAAPDLPLSCLPGMEVSTLALRGCDPDNSRELGLLLPPAQTPSESSSHNLSVLPEPPAAPRPQPQCPSQGTKTTLRRRNFSLERRRLRSNFIGVLARGRC